MFHLKTLSCDLAAPGNSQLCYPYLNSDRAKQCLVPKQQDSMINYLTFDQSVTNQNIQQNTASNKLDLSSPSTLTGIQSLLINEILPRYAFNDYTNAPQGPLAIILQSIDIPGVLSDFRERLNTFILKQDKNAGEKLMSSIDSRIEQIIRTQMILQGLDDDDPKLVAEFKKKLNVPDCGGFTPPLWDLQLNNVLGDTQINKVPFDLYQTMVNLNDNLNMLKGMFFKY